jgi:hypothetical protein
MAVCVGPAETAYRSRSVAVERKSLPHKSAVAGTFGGWNEIVRSRGKGHRFAGSGSGAGLGGFAFR